MTNPSLPGWIETEPVRLAAVAPPATFVGNPALRDRWPYRTPVALVPERMRRLAGLEGAEAIDARRDDNRSAVLPTVHTEIDGQRYWLAVKGIGASVDAFEHRPLDRERIRSICHAPELRERLDRFPEADGGLITGERWFGNTPYGGQAADNALGGLLTSLRAEGASIAGFPICPIAGVVELPPALGKVAAEFYWYRRYDRSYWQEFRWMPSNVRVYFHSPVTLGMQPSGVFHLFGLHQRAEIERFMEELARSLVAALTLYARTLRRAPHGTGYLGLEFHDVWLDKDAVIAPTGRVHFADLEGVEETRTADGAAAREAIERQFYRNLYEAAFALESAATEAERRLSAAGTLADRHRWIREILLRALRADPFVSAEERAGGLALEVHPAEDDPLLAASFDWATPGGA